MAGFQQVPAQDAPHKLSKMLITDGGQPTTKPLDVATLEIALLDGDEVVIGGVRFLGATLWTDFELHGSETLQMRARWQLRSAE